MARIIGQVSPAHRPAGVSSVTSGNGDKAIPLVRVWVEQGHGISLMSSEIIPQPYRSLVVLVFEYSGREGPAATVAVGDEVHGRHPPEQLDGVDDRWIINGRRHG